MKLTREHWEVPLIASTRRTAGAGVGSALIALLVSCTTAGTPVSEQSPETTAATTPAQPAPTSVTESPPAPPEPPSDEEEISQVVQAFQDAYNTENWDAYRQMMCPAMQDQFSGSTMDLVKKTRTDQGITRVTVTSVTVEGDSATATLDARNELLGRQTITLPMQHGDGWKVCKTS